MPERRSDLQVIAEPLGGSPLSQLVQSNHDVPWIVRRPDTPDAWRAWAETIRHSAPSWRDTLGPAFAASGAARARLDRVAAERGVVVTTGQQPGLFGGALYTWNKALSALALADAIERTTGVPAAPVFWAATDDADFAEATVTWLRTADGARRVTHHQEPSDGEPLAEVPLEGIDDALLALGEAVGSAADLEPVQAVRDTYIPGATIGSAYLALMRRLLEPLGIAVIDASHPALLEAERPLMVRALERAGPVYAALEAREKVLVEAGYRPQVAQVADLSLVFTRAVRKKMRVPLAKAADVAARAARDTLSPNVLLRPVVERALLPSVAYMAGPGELAYFAQAASVAAALDLDMPLGVPRWGCTVLEPDAMEIVSRHRVEWRALADEHRMSYEIARAAVPADVLAELEAMRGTVRTEAEAFKALVERHGNLLDPRVVDGAARGMAFRIDRLERRLLAAAKRREATTLRDIAVARGSLFPGGQRQERALNFIPLLARHGAPLVDAMRESAGRHADALLHGRQLPADG